MVNYKKKLLKGLAILAIPGAGIALGSILIIKAIREYKQKEWDKIKGET